jgi:cell wall-associated NlpC family hydrolase
MHLRALIVAVLVLACSAVFAAAPATKKVVLGKLGQATEAARIHATPSARGRVYYKVKPYEYLVVKPAKKKGWTMVFMQNQQYGYVPSDVVAMLPYEVSAEVQATPVSTRGTRGATLTSRSASAVADYALNFQGTPYKWGGNSLNGGIDCSGFVKELFKEAGVSLPRTAAEQLNVGKPITRLEHLQKGDRLYFWDSKRNMVGHTGIYLGEGWFVHSSSTRKGVATDSLTNSKWRRILVAARR